MTDHIQERAEKAARECGDRLWEHGWQPPRAGIVTAPGDLMEPIIAAAIRSAIEEAEAEKDMKRHQAGHPGETAPELSCYICREKIRAELPLRARVAELEEELGRYQMAPTADGGFRFQWRDRALAAEARVRELEENVRGFLVDIDSRKIRLAAAQSRILALEGALRERTAELMAEVTLKFLKELPAEEAEDRIKAFEAALAPQPQASGGEGKAK